MVNVNVVSTANPAIEGSPKIVKELVDDCTNTGAAKTAALIPGDVEDIVNGNPFLEVILRLLPPITTGSTRSPVPIISVLRPFNISTISLSFWGAPVFTV